MHDFLVVRVNNYLGKTSLAQVGTAAAESLTHAQMCHRSAAVQVELEARVRPCQSMWDLPEANMSQGHQFQLWLVQSEKQDTFM